MEELNLSSTGLYNPTINEQYWLQDNSLQLTTQPVMSQTELEFVENILTDSAVKLSQFTELEDFALIGKQAFGNRWKSDQSRRLIQKVLQGDSQLKIALVGGDQTGWWKGAYSHQRQTIYFKTDWLQENLTTPGAITKVFFEEIGHYLDAHLGLGDARGDEGAILAGLVMGETYTPQELLALFIENDITTVTIEGETIQIEQSSAQSDLVVSEVTIPSGVSWGQSGVEVSWTVTNQGTGTALTDWYDGIYISSDRVFDSADTFVSNRLVGSESPLRTGESYTASRTVTIPSGNGITGKPYLFVVADYHQNFEKESNEENNVRVAANLITHPDLVVSEVTIPSGVSWGHSGVEVSWTVTNQGTGTALTDWYDGIYISSDRVFDSADTFVSNRRVGSESPLRTGESYTASKTVTIPSGNGITGKPYLFVVADYYQNFEKESNEENNAGVAANLITHPDLVVSEVDITEGVTWGESAEVTWTVQNQGSGTALTDWWDTIYLSSDEFYDSSDVYLGRRRVGSESPLGTGESYTASQNVNIPAGAHIGKPYVLVRTDWGQYFRYDNLEKESNEDNNVRVASTPILTRPDLVVTEVDITEGVTWGESAEVTWTVQNQGSGTALTDWWDTIYLSSDEFYDSSDVYLGRRRVGSESPLGTGESYTASQNVNIPAGAHIGKPYVLVRTDWGQYFRYDNLEKESNEDNNVRGFNFVTVDTEAEKGDLVVTELTIPEDSITPEETFAVTWTVRNQGQTAITGNWYDYLYVSEDENFDHGDFLLTQVFPERETTLAPGESYTVTEMVTIPDFVADLGNLLLVTDRDNYGSESNESNNTLVVAYDLVPEAEKGDLVVTELTIPEDPITPGETFAVTWTVRNQGQTAITGNWYDYLYVSEDENFDHGDFLLTQVFPERETTLAPGESYTVTEMVTIPDFVADLGNLLLVTDRDNYGSESNESNNTLVVAYDLVPEAEKGDLVISTVTVPGSVTRGETIPVSVTVTNQGLTSITGGWFDSVYLSQDGIFDSEDIQLGYHQVTAETVLGTGESYTVNLDVTLLEQTEGQYLLFVTDREDFQQEVDNDNNTRGIALLFNQPDLVITDVTVPVTASIGETFEVQWTVTNQGNGSARANWHDSIYLSADSTLESTDIVVSNWKQEGLNPLAPGESYTVTQTVTLPETTGKPYLLLATDREDFQSEANEDNNVHISTTLITDSIEQVFFDDFESGASSSWLNSTIDSSHHPDVFTQFSGRFNHGSQTLTLKTIPGETYTLEWDFYPIDSWDGSHSLYGLDYFNIDIDNERVFHETFTNFPERGFPQTFTEEPDEIGSLGFISYFPDSIYRDIQLTFIAQNATTTILFADEGLQSLADESWGIDNVEVNRLFTSNPIAVHDLAVTATAPELVHPGEEFTINWNVNNLAEVPALGSWSDAIYLSSDTILDRRDTLLLKTPSLGETYQNSQHITIGNNLGVGTQYLLVVTDIDEQQKETTESNNIAVLQVELGGPDLAITEVIAPTEGTVNASIEVSWTVTNQGTGSANGQWKDLVYLSQDRVLDLNNLELISQTVQEAALGVGENYTQTRSVTLGSNLVAGDYYLLFVTDDNTQQLETGENNNLFAFEFTVEPPPHADLVVEAVAAPTHSLSGEEIQVSWRVRNQGTEATNSTTWRDAIFLSEDEILSDGDTLLAIITHEGAIARDRTYTRTAGVELPDGISGDYYILVSTDRDNRVYEYLLAGNNVGVGSETIAVTRKPEPDLQVTSLVVPDIVQAGGTYEISWTVTNLGDGVAEGEWVDLVSRKGAKAQREDLGVGESYTVVSYANIPLWEDGDYEFVVEIDAEDEVFEGDNEGNNQGVFTVRVANPDLVPTILTAPATATSGSTISLGWLVENQGLGAALGGWIDKVYLSSNQVLDPGDTLLGEFTRAGSLESGSHYSSLNDLRIPIHVRGSQYLLLVTDTGNIIFEVGAENNNTTTVALEVELTPFADLTVSNVTAPDLTVGDPGRATISWEVSNQGAGNSNVDRWVDWVVASRDGVVGNHDDVTLATYRTHLRSF